MMHRKRGFTLTELLVVIAIIVLALTLAVPAIRVMTGSRSQQAAQNVLSAVLSRARAEAIGLQRVQGVLFFIDPATDRVNCAQVIESPPRQIIRNGNIINLDVVGVTYLDLAPDHDFVSLPAGVRVQTLIDSTGNTTTGGIVGPTHFLDLFPNQRYLGFNDFGTTTVNQNVGTQNPGTPPDTLLGGVILFDGQGRVVARPYGFHFATVGISANGQTIPATPTGLGDLVFKASPDPKSQALGMPSWPSPGSLNVRVLRSQVGLVMFDRETFLNAAGQQGSPATDDDGKPAATPGPGETSEEKWLDANSTPILISRYNGTLIRAE